MAANPVEKLKRQLAMTILRTDSPLPPSFHFKQDRGTYSDFLEEHERVQSTIELIQTSRSEVSEAELAVVEATDDWQSQLAKLKNYAQNLGETTFEALQSGAINDSPLFQDLPVPVRRRGEESTRRSLRNRLCQVGTRWHVQMV